MKKFKIISLFNHKGGVSKTTSTYNIGWKMAQEGKKVLLVDADPQCNLTGLLLGDDFDEYYTNDTTRKENIKDAIKPAFEGKPTPIQTIKCFNSEFNKNLFLIPGHMDLSEYDPSLSLALNSNNAISTLQNLPGSFYELIKLCSQKYLIDYVFIDMNPGLSSINQALFMSSDAFLIPTNPDPFSIMALKTLKKILPRWKKWADNSKDIFESASYPLPDAGMKFIGEIIQRFNLRNKRPANVYQAKIQEIKDYIEKEFVPQLNKYSMVCDISSLKKQGILQDHCLAQISEFGALLQQSHKYSVPVFALNEEQMDQHGNVLTAMLKSRDRFNKEFEIIAKVILEIL